ncbi:hypothetical protein BGW39_004058 [Mortierella sp. 14UC]|nr:hypothetical protein BGW39_004058 [Mortierella sp. 14UC]
MPILALQIKAELENITELIPADADHTWHFKVQCTKCREIDSNVITMNAIDKAEMGSGRGEANLVMKCKFCKCESSADIVSKPVAYEIENNDKFATIVTVECRGLELVGFEPREGWKAKGAESGTPFEDIDLTDGDWADYDEKSELPVGISSIESKFVKVKTRNTIEKFTADAKASVAQECYALEQSLSTVASLPYLAARGIDRGLVLAVEASISQIGYGLVVILSGLISTLELLMGLLTGTWRCFLGNLADSGIPFLTNVGAEGVEAIDDLNGMVLGLFAVPFNGLGELIEAKMAAPQVGNLVTMPTLATRNIEFCDKALNLAPVDRLASDFGQWISYGIMTLLGFALVVTLGNMVMIWYHHRRYMTHVGRVQQQLREIAAESPGQTRISPALAEKPGDAIDNLDPEQTRLEAMRISHMVRHPIVYQFMEWSSKLLSRTDETKQNAYLWFTLYVTHPPAIVCLFIGLLGLTLTFGQIAFIEYMRRNYRVILAPALTDLSEVIFDSIQGSLQAASVAFSTEANAALAVVEADLNKAVFAEIVRAASDLNSTLVKVQATLVDGIPTVFGDSIFAKLVGAVLQCLLFSKLEMVERGLGWVQENARINLPRVTDDMLMMDRTQLDAMVASSIDSLMGTSQRPQPSLSNSMLFPVGSSEAQRIEGSISKVFTQYEDSLWRELPVYYGLIAVWVAILLLGLAGALARVILPSVPCLTDPNPTCKVCLSTLEPEGVKNIKRNTSAMVHFMHEDGRERNILIDCGKSFYESARQWYRYHNLRCIDALVITHAHADAYYGMDDLRSWCLLDKENPYSIPVYLDQSTMDTLSNTFPYMVDSSKATGGGDIPSFKYNIIEHDKDFVVEGVTFTPLPVHHGKFMTTGEPFWSLGFRFRDLSWVSDCSAIPDSTTAKISGSKVLVIDGLKETTHPSHFSIPEAIEYTISLDPKPERAFIVGFCHTVDHYAEDAKVRTLDSEGAPEIRIAYDGQRFSF